MNHYLQALSSRTKSEFYYISVFVLFVFVLISCTPPAHKDILRSANWIDLTHSFDQTTPYWPTAEGFRLDTVFEGITEKGYYYSAFSFCSAEHGGTHLDAPVHFAEGKQTVDAIPLENLTGFSVVIDVTDSVQSNKDYQVTASDFTAWEKKHGLIPEGSIVLIRTGFDQHWPDRKKYLGTEAVGDSAVAHLHFPGLHPDAARWLVKERSIKAIGLDTASIDFGQSSEFMSHRILFEQNIPAFENLTNLDKLSPEGDYVIALPMKIKGGSGGPLRIIAMKPGH